MSLAEVNAKVGPDGVLTCSIPTGLSAANREVIITVRTDEHVESASPMSAEEWQRFIDETAGSIVDPTFGRHKWAGEGESKQKEDGHEPGHVGA